MNANEINTRKQIWNVFFVLYLYAICFLLNMHILFVYDYWIFPRQLNKTFERFKIRSRVNCKLLQGAAKYKFSPFVHFCKPPIYKAYAPRKNHATISLKIKRNGTEDST